MPHLEYRVLGPVELLISGERLAVESAKQRLLLAALLVQAGRTVPAARLADVVWDDDPPADPAGALQTHVSRLRRVLRDAAGGDPIVTEPHGYRLETGAGALDAERFESGVRKARRDDDPRSALATLEEVLALWRGPAYGEIGTQPFALAEARRLEELRSTAREKRAELLLAVDRVEEAVALLEELAAEDPLRERPRALQMEALYRAGRPGEALGVYQQYRRALSEELGIEPSRSLSELEDRIVRRELPSTGLREEVGTPAAESAATALPEAPDLDIGYLDLESGPLAYGTVGEGPTLVVVPAFVTNLGAIAAGDDPRSPLLARLARHVRLVLYDRRGLGLSTFGEGDLSLEGGVAELEEVTGALGLESFHLLGMSQAGPIALAFAHRHPERVDHLVLHGTYADGPATFHDSAARESMLALTRSAWGIASKALTDLTYPGESAAVAHRLARMQRESATPEAAAAMLGALYRADVRSLLPEVPVPTLVLHYDEDRAIPFRGGRDLAAALPRARFVPLRGRCHLPSDTDLDRVLELLLDVLD